MHQLRQSIFTPRSFAKENLIDLNESLLRQKQQTSFWFKMFKRLRYQSTKRALSEFILMENQSLDNLLQYKQLELIDDPIYTSVLAKRKQPLFKRIANFTNQFKVFEPETTWLIFWNLIIALVILYYFFEIGLVIFLGQPVWTSELTSPITYTFNVFFIFVLCVDIFIQINTGYYKEGILVMDKLKIVKNYLKKFFIIDFISVLVVAACFFSQNMTLNYIKIVFYAKATSLSRIDTIYQKMLIFYLKWNMVYLVFRQIIIVMVSTHYLGVIFFAIDYHVYSTNYFGPSTPILSWVFQCDAYSQLIWEPWYVWYIYSFYFSLGTMTTIAYGDITPLNPIDTAYIILVLVLCCIQFSYVLYNIIEIFFMGKAAQSRKDQQNVHLNKYLKTHFVSKKLQVKIKSFLEQTWNSEMYRDRQIENQMLNKLPHQLKTQLLTQVYEKFAIQLLAFKYPKEFIRGMVELISQYRCSPEENIIKPSEPIQDMYYLVNGKVSFYLTPKLHLKVSTQTAFGIIQFYTQSQVEFSVVTIQDSNIYKISFADFQRMVRSRQTYLQIMKNIADEAREQSRKCQLFNIQCFICQQRTHMSLKCPNTHYIINPFQSNSFYFQFKQLRQKFRRSGTRRRFKKYMDRRRSQTHSAAEIGFKHKATLEQISQMDICTDLDFNDIEEFVDQSLSLLRDIESGLRMVENREDEEEECMQQMKQYQIYMRSGNIRNVIRRLKENQ